MKYFCEILLSFMKYYCSFLCFRQFAVDLDKMNVVLEQ